MLARNCTTLVQRYNDGMAAPKKVDRSSTRQSITIPVALAAEIRAVARRRHWTMSQAVVALAERGVRAEAEAERALRASHRRFLRAASDTERAAAGRDLIQAVFGEQALAEDQVR